MHQENTHSFTVASVLSTFHMLVHQWHNVSCVPLLYYMNRIVLVACNHVFVKAGAVKR